MTERIGFIGAGMMGHGICRNLLKAGYPLTVVAHRNRAPIEDLLAHGATEAASQPELAGRSDIVMICVNSADAVAEIVAAITPRLARGAVIIDVTTSKPETSRRLAAALATAGVGFVDAPVVGGPSQAAEGKLGTLAGGAPADFERARPILECYSADVTHFGDVGAGNTAKLLSNFLTVGLRQLVTQSFRAARRNGVDEAKLYRMMRQGAAGSRVLDTMVAGSLEGNYRGNAFSIANCHKDMAYAGELLATDPDGRSIQSAMLAAYRRLVDAGFGDRFASEMMDPEVEHKAAG